MLINGTKEGREQVVKASLRGNNWLDCMEKFELIYVYKIKLNKEPQSSKKNSLHSFSLLSKRFVKICHNI